jgi:hypothetical protein
MQVGARRQSGVELPQSKKAKRPRAESKHRAHFEAALAETFYYAFGGASVYFFAATSGGSK